MQDHPLMQRNSSSEFDPESAIIDAELLVKYRMVNRAIEALERGIDRLPRHAALREKLLEVLIDAGRRDQAAQQCLALASLHISEGKIDEANEILQQAKRLDPRVSVSSQLTDMRRASEPGTQPHKILTGNLGEINLFDIIQILENSRLTGVLKLMSSSANGDVQFNEGQIVGARVASELAMKSLSLLLSAADGTFEFEKSGQLFEPAITATSNTALILDMLRAKDEENEGLATLDF